MNPALTQAEFTRLAQRFFYALCKYSVVRETRYRFDRSEVRVHDENDFNANTASWSLVGAVLGTNTDADGKIFVRVTGAGPYTVSLYKATGGGAGDKVAEGAGAAGATVTLAEQQSSGLSGTVVLAAVVTAEIDDVHYLSCFVDFPTRDASEFSGAEDKDSKLLTNALALNTSVVSLLQSAEAQIITHAKFILTEFVRGRINSGATVGLVKRATRDQGAVSLEVTGIIEDLRSAMVDNTTVQYILKNVIAAGAAAFAAGNIGKGSITSPTFYEKILPGVITGRCATEVIGQEEFDITLTRTDTGEVIRAAGRLRVKREFKDANIGISSLILARTFSKTGDAGHTDLSDVTDGSWSVDGETSTFTNAGTLYWQIIANGANWNIEFYRASTYQTGDLVAKATNVATGAVFQATQQNSSGLTVNGTVGSGPVTAHQGTFLLQPFKSGPPADTWTITITRTSAGEIQTLLAELISETLDWYLNSGVIGVVTLPDGLLLRGGMALRE